MIPGVLRLTSRIKYGMTSRNVPLYLFEPFDRTLSPCIVGSSEKDVSSNALALITVEKWDPSNLTRGTLIRLLGKCGDLKAEEDAILYQYKAAGWKKNTPVQTPTFPDHIPISGYTFNVDPEGCLDIDDTITIGNDGYLYITIADVATWMTVNPDIFQKATTIGQTLYKNGQVVEPLLPIQNQCSLRPKEKRYGVALKCKWDGTDLTDLSFQKVELTNTESFTYETIQYSKHAKLLRSLASHLGKRDIIDPHEWIEELMLFYNSEVAKKLVTLQDGVLRCQHPPDFEKYNSYYHLGADLEFLSNKSAFYTHATTPVHHWGLSRAIYCHASSPIRRVSDIVNQMVLCGYSVPTYNIQTLNERSTASKKYERDSFFLREVMKYPSRRIRGIALTDHRVWVPLWKRIVTCNNTAIPGRLGLLYYSLDMDQPSWKKRMVFRFEGTDCQE